MDSAFCDNANPPVGSSNNTNSETAIFIYDDKIGFKLANNFSHTIHHRSRVEKEAQGTDLQIDNDILNYKPAGFYENCLASNWRHSRTF